MFKFEIKSKSGKRARAGLLETGKITTETPELAIVATDAQLRSLPNEVLKELPSQYFIVNTYHTFTKKIIPKIENSGGVHSYMGLKDRLIATDSGGFQVFSLGFGQKHQIGKIARTNIDKKLFENKDEENPIEITEEGVNFVLDNQKLKLNPEIRINR